MPRSIFVGSLEVFFSSGSAVLIISTLDISFFANWLRGRNTHERFKRWVPPPPNPTPMKDEEKNLATQRRLESPHRCDYRDPTMIQRAGRATMREEQAGRLQTGEGSRALRGDGGGARPWRRSSGSATVELGLLGRNGGCSSGRGARAPGWAATVELRPMASGAGAAVREVRGDGGCRGRGGGERGKGEDGEMEIRRRLNPSSAPRSVVLS
jgi:hypothetical protein